jgi:hypothetical protein
MAERKPSNAIWQKETLEPAYLFQGEFAILSDRSKGRTTN